MSVLKLQHVHSRRQPIAVLIGCMLSLLCNPLSASNAVWKKGDPLPGFSSWPKINNVVVSAKVNICSGTYRYDFGVFNPPKNQFPIAGFEVDLRSDPLDHSFSHEDLTTAHRLGEHRKILEEAGKASVFAPKSPPGWNLCNSNNGDAKTFDGCWSAQELKPEILIKPGKRAVGFSMGSQLPPGIREYIAGAWSYEFDYGIDSLPPAQFNYYYNSVEYHVERSKGITFLSKTIAPVPPPEPFTASSWTARMTLDAIEARKQNWIKTDKVLAEIKRLISALNTGDIAKLKAAVKKAETYVLAEKKKGNLTDEADALVRLNAQYLLRRLENPAEQSNEDSKKE